MKLFNPKKISYKIYFGLLSFILPIQRVYAQFDQLVTCDGPDCDISHFFEMIQRVVQFALSIGIAFVAIVFASAGFIYLTARGDSSKIKRAHGMFTKAVFGFVIALSAYLIVELLAVSLGLDSEILRFVT